MSGGMGGNGSGTVHFDLKRLSVLDIYDPGNMVSCEPL